LKYEKQTPFDTPRYLKTLKSLRERKTTKAIQNNSEVNSCGSLPVKVNLDAQEKREKS